MTHAYKSVLDISFSVKAGLLIRQTHHWAADVFIVAIVLHLLRVFFTGAFRRPREITYVLGVTMLALALLEGYLGYSLVDDLLQPLPAGYGAYLIGLDTSSCFALGLRGMPPPDVDELDAMQPDITPAFPPPGSGSCAHTRRSPVAWTRTSRPSTI